MARDAGHALHFLCFDYQQRNARELACARDVARSVAPDAPFDVVRVDFECLARHGLTGLLAGKDREPMEDPPAYGYYVPGRNMVFLSHAAALAEVEGLDEIHVATHLQDVVGRNGPTYPDSGAAFLHDAEKLLNAGRKYGHQVRLVAPLLRFTKFELIRLGHARGFDFSMTWTCYKAGPEACGACPSCQMRLVSFLWAGLDDPLPYQIPPARALALALDAYGAADAMLESSR